MLKRKILTHQLLVAMGVLLLSLTACRELEALLPATTNGLVTTLQGHTSTITSLAFSPDGGTLASASVDTTVRLWDVATGEELATLNGHPIQVNAVAFSPDGKLLASGSGDFLGSIDVRVEENGTPYVLRNGTPVPLPNMVILWDVASGKELKRWGGFKTGFWTVAFSPDGKMLAAGGGTPSAPIDDTTRFWNVNTSEFEMALEELSSIWSITFSPDGRVLASGNGKGITLWNLATRQRITALGRIAARSVAYSPDGRVLAASNGLGTIQLWNTDTNQEQAELRKHEGIVYSLAFNPDATIVASAGQDGTVRLWDMATAKEIATIRIPGTAVVSVAFSPDRKLLATGGTDGLIRIWNVAEVLGQ